MEGTNSSFRLWIAFALVVLFFGGGIFLDYMGSQLSVEISDIASKTEASKAITEFSKRQADNLNSSAKVLYDFAKITLGVLLTLLSADAAKRAPPTSPARTRSNGNEPEQSAPPSQSQPN